MNKTAIKTVVDGFNQCVNGNGIAKKKYNKIGTRALPKCPSGQSAAGLLSTHRTLVETCGHACESSTAAKEKIVNNPTKLKSFDC